MYEREVRNRSAGIGGTPVLVTDTTILTGTDMAPDMQRREGDVVFGLRVGLALSAVLWFAIIAGSFLIVG